MSDGLHLSPDHRGVLESLLREHLPDVEVWAYGSRVNGQSHAGSDLDLALRGLGLEEIPAEQLADFSDAVRESTIPFPVEARDWSRLPERFRSEISRDHMLLVSGKAVGASRRGARRGWTLLNLGQICTKIGSGATPRGGKDVYLPHGPYALIRSQNVLNEGFRDEGLAYIGGPHASQLQNVEVAEDDVLLNITGDSVARVCQVRPDVLPARVNQHVAIVRPDPAELDPRFLRYALVSPKMQIKLLSWAGSGATRNALTKGMIESLSVAAPRDVYMQRAIAHILGTLDDKIELNRRMNETLEGMSRALFKSWFEHFEPVRANAEPADARLAHDAYELFPDSFDDSALGKAPRGWKVVALTELIDVNPRRPSLRKGEIAPYVPMSSMPTSGHTPSQVSDRPFGSGMRFTNGDTLVARITPCLENGKTAYVDFLKEGQVAWGSTEYIVLRPKPFLPSEFAYCLARSSGFREFAIQSMTGTSGRQRVQPTALGQFLLPQPPEQVGKEFGRLIRPLIGRARTAADESHRLAGLRDALLPRLLSGELRVPDAERIAATVT